MPTDTPEDRYGRDPLFRAFVDTIHVMLRRAEMSPTEVREGAMLACIHFERARPPTPRVFERFENTDTREAKLRSSSAFFRSGGAEW